MKNLTLLVIAFLNSILSQAQVTETPTKLEDALLWKITGNGLQKSSYLLGTMHTVEFSFMFDSISGMQKVFSTVEQVATEIDMIALDSIRRKTPYGANDYFMPSDTTYSMLYSAEDFAFVDSVLSAGNARYAERVPAFWQEIYISYELSLRSSKHKQKKVVMDYFVLQFARKNSKKAFFLETLQEISNKNKRAHKSKYSQDLKGQASSLLFILKNPDVLSNIYNELDSLYRAQKLSMFSIDKLTKYFADLFEGLTEDDFRNNDLLKANNSILLKERNDAWMAKIPKIMQQGSTLIAVGAMHLTGNTGLINQLRKMGYTVKPVE